MDKVEKIRDQIKREHEQLQNAPDWFYDKHLLGVEHFARELLKQIPEADEEVVLLGVWLHDIQRFRGIEGDHAEIGAQEAEKVLREYNYDTDTIEKVKDIILTHTCGSEDKMPQSTEGQILASADAMSHFIHDFYLRMAIRGKRNTEDFKIWALEKLERDYNKKIYFDFAREMIKERYETIKKFIELD